MDYQILNLANQEASTIQYKVSKFPDGQQTIDLEFYNNDYPVRIISRLNSFKDLELIICANQALLEAGSENVHLYTPYFLGARSDRKFQEGGINYLKTVICPVINSQNFKTVTVMDPHSDVLEACLNNFKAISSLEFADKVLKNFSEDIVLVSPDAGALKKVFKIQQKYGIKDMIIGAKNRDLDGKITHTSISGPSDLDLGKGRTFVIFDDICDGGRTFIELAKVIKATYGDDAKVVLAVTHGIFTKGIKVLNEYIDYVYTTNSVIKDLNQCCLYEELHGAEKITTIYNVLTK